MICQACGAENEDGAAFCNECGTALMPIPDQSNIASKRKNTSKRQNDVIPPKIQKREDLRVDFVAQSGATSPLPKKARFFLVGGSYWNNIFIFHHRFIIYKWYGSKHPCNGYIQCKCNPDSFRISDTNYNSRAGPNCRNMALDTV